jgi:hypothetical protein
VKDSGSAHAEMRPALRNCSRAMRNSPLALMTLLSFLLWVSGCKRASPPAVQPVAGTNISLRYPVIIFSKARDVIEARSNEKELTTTSILRQSIFEEGMQLVDSSGTLYLVESQKAAEKVPGWLQNSTGNAPYRIELQLRRVRPVTLDETKQLLLEVIENPKSYWSQSHHGNAAAVKILKSAKTFAQLAASCGTSSVWL